MMKKRLICICLSILVVFSLFSGCGNVENSDDNIELLEPVGVTPNYVKAERRDLTSYKVYSGKVVPKVTEVSFSTDQRFDSYGKLPGTEVKPGDVLIYASTESIDKEIENLEKKMKSAQESYDETIKDCNDELAKAEASRDYNEKIVHNFEAMNDAEKAAYNNYDSEYAKYKYAYSSAIASCEKLSEKIKETTELFILDSDYDKLVLNRLKNDRKKVLVTAPSSGEVVAVGNFDYYQYIEKDYPVAAIGNLNELQVKCDFVYKSEIKRAVEYYAIVNGNRYDALYIDETTDENSSAQTSQTNDITSYSTFVLDDPNHEVKAGDFVSIVVVSSVREGAICVPYESVEVDEDGAYVYVHEGETNSYRQIKTGLKSGFYVEVVSGLSEGEEIVSEFKVPKKTNTETLSKGKICVLFNDTGYIFYAKDEPAKNPVENGTTYIKEICVKTYERVTKGQTLATVYVTPDDINIKRTERTLLRAQEDLSELMKNEKDNEKLIKNKNQYISDLKEKLDKLYTDANTTEIVAAYDGIVTYLYDFKEGDIILPKATLGYVADEKDCFIMVEDKNGQLTYGNEALVQYNDGEAQKTAVGKVVNVSSCAISQELSIDRALISVSPEEFSKMCSSNLTPEGWYRRSFFNVTAEVRSMDNVILVPKRAVSVDSGVTYVTVLDENGNYVYKSFIAGGGDNLNYWVVDGLEEGMKICLE